MLHVALALVARRIEHLAVTSRREVGRQQANGRQRQLTAGEPIEDDGEALCRTRRLDAPVGRVLGQVQHLRAVRKQRRAPFAEVEPSRIELRQRRDQLSI